MKYFYLTISLFFLVGCSNEDDDKDELLPPDTNLISANVTRFDATVNGVPYKADLNSVLNTITWSHGNEFTFLVNNKEDDGWIEVVITQGDFVREYSLGFDEYEPHADYVQWKSKARPVVFRNWRSDFGSANIRVNNGVSASGTFLFTGVLKDVSGDGSLTSEERVTVKGAFTLMAR